MNSSTILRCTSRSTTAVAVMASLKILSHSEKTKSEDNVRNLAHIFCPG